MLGLGNNIFKSSTAEGSLVSNRVSFIGLLNETYGADAEAAYSVRKLSSSATVAMTIRRESDNEELAIGFVDGNINEAAIEAHCTGTTCRVVQWNDQSGNDNHATQDSEGAQPTIYTGGALVKENGKVAVDFDGSSDNYLFFVGAIGISGADPRTYIAVLNPDVNANETVIQHGDNNVAQNMQHFILTTELGNRYYGSNNLFATSNTSQMLVFNPLIGDSAHDTEMYLDGTQLSYTSRGPDSTLNTADSYLSIGISNVGTLVNEYNGNMQEIIIYGSDKSGTDQTSIESNINTFYNIYS